MTWRNLTDSMARLNHRYSAGILGILFSVAIIAILLQKADTATHVLAPRSNNVSMTPLPLQPVSVDGAAWLKVELAGRWTRSVPTQIGLLLGTYGQRPNLVQSRLVWPDQNCTVAGPAGRPLEDNAELVFHLEGSCAERAIAVPGRLTLELQLPANYGAALWVANGALPSWFGANGFAPHALPEKSEPTYAIGSTKSNIENRVTRATLIAAQWDLSTTQLWATVLTSLTLLSLAFWHVANQVSRTRPASSRFILPLSLFTFLISLGCLWAVFVPPFQAPDEPDHVRGYLITIGQPDRDAQLLAFSQRNHFERLKFNATETFSTRDIGNPLPANWSSHVEIVDHLSRAPLVHYLWKATAWLAPATTAGLLLYLRGLGLVFISLAITLGAMLLSRLHGRVAPIFAFAFTTIPTFFFFGLHVSNYPFSMAILIVLSAITAYTIVAEQGSLWATPSILACSIFLLAINPTMLPIAPALSSTTAVAWLLRTSAKPKPKQIAENLLWLGTCATSSLLAVVPVLALGGVWIARAQQARLPQENALIALCAGGAICAAFVGILAPFAKSYLNRVSALWSAIKPNYRLVAACGLVACLVSLFSWKGRFPVPSLETGAFLGTPIEYAKVVAKGFLGTLFFGHFDRGIGAFFWGGFGWLESLPHPLLLWIPKLILTLAIVGLFLMWLHRGKVTQAATGTVFFIGVVAGAALLAWVLASTNNADTSGRYLISTYLILCAIVPPLLLIELQSQTSTWQKLYRNLLLLCALGTQIGGLSFILHRYFT